MGHFKRADQQGFTLIEVLIVVVIIAVLASLIVPRMMGSPEKAKIAEAYQMIGSLVRAQQRHMDTTGSPTPIAFLCPAAPSACTLSSSFGMKDIQQKDFRYSCDTYLGCHYCGAYRSVAGSPLATYYYTGVYTGQWGCADGYVTADTGVVGFSDKGCKPNW